MLMMLIVGWIGLLPAITIAVLCVAPRFHDRVRTRLAPAHTDAQAHATWARADVHLTIDDFLAPPAPAGAPTEPPRDAVTDDDERPRRSVDELLTPARQHVGDRA